jgi:bifunctional non-homologous end joining protein LigD
MDQREIKKLPKARKSNLPQFISPQLATLVKEPPTGDEWVHELKFDGYRMLCRIDRGRVSVWSRNGKEWTAKFVNVVAAVKELKLTSAILDGEIVIVDPQGRTSFQKLQERWAKPRLRASPTRSLIYSISTGSTSRRRR